MDDEEKDPSYFEKESVKKTPRPPFKTDAYRRLALQHGAVRCNGTEGKIKGQAPYWKYQEGLNWVYLTKDYKEMRTDKSAALWRKIDKDHQIDYIAIIAAAKEHVKLKPHERDFALSLAFKSTKHLRFIPRNSHKKKKTYRLHTVPAGLKNTAKGLLSAKVGKKKNPKYRRHYLELKNAHAANNAPSWSVENYQSTFRRNLYPHVGRVGRRQPARPIADRPLPVHSTFPNSRSETRQFTFASKQQLLGPSQLL
jgi:hypothetical protein